MTTTWEDQNRALFRALRLEKLVTALFIGLITFVAGLNILVVLSMSVTDRAKDIAVLMSLGAYRPQVRNIFMLQGLTVGVIGTVSGLIAGYAICLGRRHLSLDSARSRKSIPCPTCRSKPARSTECGSPRRPWPSARPPR